MRNYHYKQGLGEVSAEKGDQSNMDENILFNYRTAYRKNIVKVCYTTNFNALQPDVIFYRKGPTHLWGLGKAILVVEIEDNVDFKKVLKLQTARGICL